MTEYSITPKDQRKIFFKPDIVEIVSKYIVLRHVGKNVRAQCPFHAERTPSFFVRPYSQTFTCYGCGKKGDVISFVMEMENLDFKSACEKLGIELKPTQKTFKEIARRKAVKKFRVWCDNYFDKLCFFYRTLQDAKAKATTIEQVELLSPLYHKESVWQWHIEILLDGDDEAKFKLFREVVYGD
jgi:DNA primase